jgi:hypothetical protein
MARLDHLDALAKDRKDRSTRGTIKRLRKLAELGGTEWPEPPKDLNDHFTIDSNINGLRKHSHLGLGFYGKEWIVEALAMLERRDGVSG